MNSDASEAHFAYLGSFLRSRAETLQNKDPHFKKLVEIARKWQREREQRRKQQGRKKAP
jgi:nuclear transport factor 2 (NTF2) superfamily protein